MNAANTLTAPVIPSLFTCAQALRAVPTDYVVLTTRDRLLSESERNRRGTVVAGRDGLQRDPRGLEYVGVEGARLNEVLADLERAVDLEDCRDVRADWTTLRLDRRDGYLYRESRTAGEALTGGPAIAVTDHSIGQLVGVLTAGGTGWRSTSAAFGGVSPSVRALLLLELQATAKRERSENVVVRTALRQIEESDGVRFGAPSYVMRSERVARAVVTPRHSGAAFDDRNLARVLRSVASGDSRATFLRAELGTESRGWVEVGEKGAHKGLSLAVTFRNSETGQARLSFRGSARISALDAVIVAHRAAYVEEVTLTTAGGAAERNHTLPTLLTRELSTAHPTMPSARFRTGTKLTTADREIIAADRMTASFAQATEASLQLAAAWAVALTDFAPGFVAELFSGTDAATQAEVLLDMCEEFGISLGKDRAALAKVLTDDARLAALSHGSAAHVAACYAVLAAQRTTVEVDGKTVTSALPWAEAERLQQAAGRWVACGWDRKAHRAALGEE